MRIYRVCSADGCGARALSRGLCSAHYQAAIRAAKPPCVRDGCSRRAFASGLCNSHYKESLSESRPNCVVAGCSSVADTFRHGLCKMHETRWRRHGDPTETAIKSGAASRNWKGPDVGYTAAHDRIKAVRGPASGHMCVWCGIPAADWAYMHDSDPSPMFCGRLRLYYSGDPSKYQAMCRTCHVAYDT